jgi:hypothetical protein
MTQEQVNQIVEAIHGLTEQISELSYQLQGDGGHTVGDSLEGIMIKLLKEEKKG